MRLEDLKLFRDVVAEHSVSRGAELNEITQSAASQQLKELDNQCQVPLLDRSRRPLAPTPAGELFLAFCETVLREKEELDAALSEFRADVEGTVHLTTIYSVGLSEVAQLQAEFAKRFPQVELVVEYLRPERIYEAILAGRADLGIVSYPSATRDLVVIPWRQEEMVVAAAPTHRLAQFPSLHPAQLEGASFVAFDQELPIQHHIEKYLREQKVTVKKVIHLDNLDSIREAVAQQVGITIAPKPALKSFLDQGRIVAIPLVPKGLRRPLGIVHRRKKKFTRAAQAFLDLLRELSMPPKTPVVADAQ